MMHLSEPYLTAGLSAVAAFIGAWLAAIFALERFYREKTWERRADAYTAIFSALHDFEKWFDRHLEADERGIDLTDELKTKLTAEYEKSGADLQRRIASETWLISDAFRTRIEALEPELKKQQFSSRENWPDFLNNSAVIIGKAFVDLRAMFVVR